MNRKTREGRQSKGQGYNELGLGSKAKGETWESLISKEEFSRGLMLPTLKVTTRVIPKRVGTEANAAEWPGWPRRKKGVVWTVWRRKLLGASGQGQCRRCTVSRKARGRHRRCGQEEAPPEKGDRWRKKAMGSFGHQATQKQRWVRKLPKMCD